jgi:sugar phosphate isomerase/epimerase
MHELPFVHIPFARLDPFLPFLLEQGLPPEIAFKGPELEGLDLAKLSETGRRLAARGLPVAVHAPFMDLNPGALEPLVFQATQRRFTQTLGAAGALKAQITVFHPGFDRWRYGDQGSLWVDQNLRFWPPLLRTAEKHGCVMALENIFEQTPHLLRQLLDTLDSPWLGHCFDVGHWNLFSKLSLEEWLQSLGHRTVHVHLHDNRGLADEHLAIGDGKIDFAEFFHQLRRLKVFPSLTLEGHAPETLLRSLSAVTPFLAP